MCTAQLKLGNTKLRFFRDYMGLILVHCTWRYMNVLLIDWLIFID